MVSVRVDMLDYEQVEDFVDGWWMFGCRGIIIDDGHGSCYGCLDAWKRKGIAGWMNGQQKRSPELRFRKKTVKLTTPASWDFNILIYLFYDWYGLMLLLALPRGFWRFRLWFVCFRVFEACGELWFPFEFHRQYPRAGVQELHWTMMIKLPRFCFILSYYTNVAIVRVPYSDVRLKGSSRSVKSTDCMGQQANHAIRVLSCYRGSRWILQQTWILPGTCVAKTQLSTATCLSGLTLYNSNNSADASVILRRHVAVCHLCVLFPWQRLWNCHSICKWRGFFPFGDIFLKGLSPFSCLVGNLRMDCMDQWKDGCIDLTKGSIHLHGGRGLGKDSSFASRMDGWVACQSKGATKKT